MVKKARMDTKQIGSLCLLVLVVVSYLVYSSYFKKTENLGGFKFRKIAREQAKRELERRRKKKRTRKKSTKKSTRKKTNKISMV